MGLVASKDQLKWRDGRTEREGKWDLSDKKRYCDGEVRGDDGAKEQGVWATYTGENKNRTFANESPTLNFISTRAERLKAQWLFIIYDQSYSLNKQLMNALRLRLGRH